MDLSSQKVLIVPLGNQPRKPPSIKGPNNAVAIMGIRAIFFFLLSILHATFHRIVTCTANHKQSQDKIWEFRPQPRTHHFKT